MTDGRSRAILRIRFRASWKRCWSVWLVVRWKCMDQAATDAGVHAMGQVANFHLPDGCRPDAEWIRNYLNQYLPEDIAITELIMVPERFHSRLSAVKKIYTYQIETGTKKNVFSRRTCYGLGQALDITAMQKAAESTLRNS